MTDTVTEPVKDLITEFREQAKLIEVDAYRAAFCALAFNDPAWTNVRIGRHLGISRARVGQRIDKLRWYTETYDMPVLTRLLDTAQRPALNGATGPTVAFKADDWRDPEFARGMLAQHFGDA